MWLPAFLGACALLVAAGWLLVACLGAYALVVGRLVVGGYLHALVVRVLVVRVGWKWLPARLEPCALLVGVSLCVLVVTCMPWWLVGWWFAVTCVPWSFCLGWCAWWWLPACLGGWCVLVVGVLGGGYLHALVVGRLVVGGYLCTLELVPCWVLRERS